MCSYWYVFQPATWDSCQSEIITVWSSASLVYFIKLLIEVFLFVFHSLNVPMFQTRYESVSHVRLSPDSTFKQHATCGSGEDIVQHSV